MRLAVVIQMPVRDQGEGGKKRQSWTSDEEEEEVAWETGMELGVWEGVVGR
jgi:glucose dehydrogenase